MTTTSPHTGTPRYLAPELLSDPPAMPSKASDVWALGCIGLEVRLFRSPYDISFLMGVYLYLSVSPWHPALQETEKSIRYTPQNRFWGESSRKAKESRCFTRRHLGHFRRMLAADALEACDDVIDSSST
jgi:serine/threonine protein kinase